MMTPDLSLYLWSLFCVPLSLPSGYLAYRLKYCIFSINNIQSQKIILKGCSKVIILGQFSTSTHFSCSFLMVKSSLHYFSFNFINYLSLALRLPITSGLIIATLTSGDLGPRDLVCDILRDLTTLSMVTTSNWAIITIMFR